MSWEKILRKESLFYKPATIQTTKYKKSLAAKLARHFQFY